MSKNDSVKREKIIGNDKKVKQANNPAASVRTPVLPTKIVYCRVKETALPIKVERKGEQKTIETEKKQK